MILEEFVEDAAGAAEEVEAMKRRRRSCNIVAVMD
jgi:hypothetical protein